MGSPFSSGCHRAFRDKTIRTGQALGKHRADQSARHRVLRRHGHRLAMPARMCVEKSHLCPAGYVRGCHVAVWLARQAVGQPMGPSSDHNGFSITAVSRGHALGKFYPDVLRRRLSDEPVVRLSSRRQPIPGSSSNRPLHSTLERRQRVCVESPLFLSLAVGARDRQLRKRVVQGHDVPQHTPASANDHPRSVFFRPDARVRQLGQRPTYRRSFAANARGAHYGSRHERQSSHDCYGHYDSLQTGGQAGPSVRLCLKNKRLEKNI